MTLQEIINTIGQALPQGEENDELHHQLDFKVHGLQCDLERAQERIEDLEWILSRISEIATTKKIA